MTYARRILALSLAISLTAACVFAAMVSAQQRRLAGQLVRLRVVAASDRSEDQQLKLQVRDAVLAAARPLLEDAADQGDAARVLAENVDALGTAAREAVRRGGSEAPVRASLRAESAGTRRYGTFTLPAGAYLTLRVDIGQAAGQNWWCVVFPPLCQSAAEEFAEETGLTAAEAGFLLGGEESYALRFRTLELLERFRRWLAGE